jgi:glyceraldehyde 3-phosphate dehydrogenase
MAARVAINGFGRSGRNFFRAVHERPGNIEIVAVNDLTTADILAHLLKRDALLGGFPGDVITDANSLVVDGHRVTLLAQPDLVRLPWFELDIELVVETTDVHREKARRHLERGAKKVVISAPARDSDVTICMGVNHIAYYSGRHNVISNASGTTNCLAPVAMVLHDSFGIESGLITTILANTSHQRRLGGPHTDRRRPRAAASSIVPSTTSATRTLFLVLPALEGRLSAVALCVPVADVSLVDLTATLRLPATAADVNSALRQAASGGLRGILSVCDEELVSSDFLRDSHSSIVDGPLTVAIGDRSVKVMAWYNNEWGLTCRLLDLVRYVIEGP